MTAVLARLFISLYLRLVVASEVHVCFILILHYCSFSFMSFIMHMLLLAVVLSAM